MHVNPFCAWMNMSRSGRDRALATLRRMADGRGILVTWRDGKHVISGPEIDTLTDLVAARAIVPDPEVLTAYQKEHGAIGYAITALGRELAAAGLPAGVTQ